MGTYNLCGHGGGVNGADTFGSEHLPKLVCDAIDHELEHGQSPDAW